MHWQLWFLVSECLDYRRCWRWSDTELLYVVYVLKLYSEEQIQSIPHSSCGILQEFQVFSLVRGMWIMWIIFPVCQALSQLLVTMTDNLNYQCKKSKALILQTLMTVRFWSAKHFVSAFKLRNTWTRVPLALCGARLQLTSLCSAQWNHWLGGVLSLLQKAPQSSTRGWQRWSFVHKGSKSKIEKLEVILCFYPWLYSISVTQLSNTEEYFKAGYSSFYLVSIKHFVLIFNKDCYKANLKLGAK